MSFLILGLDPGTRVTGFGLVEIRGERLVHVRHGIIELGESAPLANRLMILSKSLAQVLSEHHPHAVVLEKIFLGKNVDSAFKLGHARGVLMAEAAKVNLTVTEYAARKVRKGVTGNGGATKEESQLVVQNLLGIRGIQKLDAADALALACYHAFEMRKEALLKRVTSKEARF